MELPDGAGDAHFEIERYVTSGCAPVGGYIKERPEDFLVEEIPLYEPCGTGEHIYLFVEKRGMTTMDLVHLVSRHFRVKRNAVGFAGMKDKMAITRQVLSIHAPRLTIDDVPPLEHPDVSVLWADRHTNKLRRGHLTGNRFSIRIRGVEPAAAITAQRVLQQLERSGVPNRFGEQRFGYLENNHMIGAHLMGGELRRAMDLLLAPHPKAPPHQVAARDAYAAGDLETAAAAFPRWFRTESHLLRQMAAGQSVEEAWSKVDPTVRSYYYSSFQSAVFNTVLDERLDAGTIGQIAAGDVAMRIRGRACFEVTPERLAEPELLDDVRAFEVSATGPMWGPKMQRASGDVDRLELRALAGFGMTPADLDRAVDMELESIEGARRPLRVRLGNPQVEGGVDEHGAYVRCAFDLPRGSFATTVMRELIKPARGQPIVIEHNDERAPTRGPKASVSPPGRADAGGGAIGGLMG